MIVKPLFQVLDAIGDPVDINVTYTAGYFNHASTRGFIARLYTGNSQEGFIVGVNDRGRNSGGFTEGYNEVGAHAPYALRSHYEYLDLQFDRELLVTRFLFGWGGIEMMRAGGVSVRNVGNFSGLTTHPWYSESMPPGETGLLLPANAILRIWSRPRISSVRDGGLRGIRVVVPAVEPSTAGVPGTDGSPGELVITTCPT